MKHRIVWPLVAALSLGGVVAFLSQSPAQRAGGGAPAGTPGRFAVAHASVDRNAAATVLILDTATGQVYRVHEGDIKEASDLPRLGGEARTPPRDRDGRRPSAKEEDKDKKSRNPKGDAPPRREER